jgi:hypothetical protein
MDRPLAVLVHGMGRTPVSMVLLALRLRRAGFATAIFGYLATLERFPACAARLQRFIEKRAGAVPFIVVGHSLGTVLLRDVLPRLARAPAACFLLAPPARACVGARMFAPFLPYRIITGEMGQLLADERFMASVPVPACPTWIYAGTGGPRGAFYPLGDEPNDGILKVSETQISGVPVVLVPAMHTFLMNSRLVARDLIGKASALVNRSAPPARDALTVPGE